MILWQGKTPVTGRTEKIQAIITGHETGKPTANAKTGAMATIWIDLVDVSPRDAQLDGSYKAVCDGCTHGADVNGTCYAAGLPIRAHQATWKAHKKRGAGVETLTRQHIDNISRSGLRFGGDGDPSMLPPNLVKMLARVAARAGWTGYTQQWRKDKNQWLRHFLMASCDTIEDAEKAESLGWRAFYVRPKNTPLPPNFTQCPAAKEGGRRTTCQRCNLCNGSTGDNDRRRSISTELHN